MRTILKLNIPLEVEYHGGHHGGQLDRFNKHIDQLADEALRSAGLKPGPITIESMEVDGITETEARRFAKEHLPIRLKESPKAKNCFITCVYPPDGVNPAMAWVSNGKNVSSLFHLKDLMPWYL